MHSKVKCLIKKMIFKLKEQFKYFNSIHLQIVILLFNANDSQLRKYSKDVHRFLRNMPDRCLNDRHQKSRLPFISKEFIDHRSGHQYAQKQKVKNKYQ